MIVVPPLHSVSQISKIGCSMPCRPGLSANIHPEKIRLSFFCSSISSTWAKTSVCGASVGQRGSATARGDLQRAELHGLVNRHLERDQSGR